MLKSCRLTARRPCMRKMRYVFVCCSESVNVLPLEGAGVEWWGGEGPHQRARQVEFLLRLRVLVGVVHGHGARALTQQRVAKVLLARCSRGLGGSGMG